MKKLLTITLTLLLATVAFSQQNRKEIKAKIEAEKVAFITKTIELTPAEAEKFWPVYNEFNEKLEFNKRKHRKTIRTIERKENLTEADYATINDAQHNLKQEEARLFGEYYGKFKTVLPASKIYKLQKAEHKFKKELIKRIREKTK